MTGAGVDQVQNSGFRASIARKPQTRLTRIALLERKWRRLATPHCPTCRNACQISEAISLSKRPHVFGSWLLAREGSTRISTIAVLTPRALPPSSRCLSSWSNGLCEKAHRASASLQLRARERKSPPPITAWPRGSSRPAGDGVPSSEGAQRIRNVCGGVVVGDSGLSKGIPRKVGPRASRACRVVLCRLATRLRTHGSGACEDVGRGSLWEPPHAKRPCRKASSARTGVPACGSHDADGLLEEAWLRHRHRRRRHRHTKKLFDLR